MGQMGQNTGCEGGEAGKRKGLKSLYPQGFAGSTPAPRTRANGLKIPQYVVPQVGESHNWLLSDQSWGSPFICLQLSTCGSSFRLGQKLGQTLVKVVCDFHNATYS